MYRDGHSQTALAAFFRLLSEIVRQWKILALVLFFLSPIGPHLRWEYTYREVGSHRVYLSCTYLGSRGFITPDYVENCPFIAWLDARPWAR